MVNSNFYLEKRKTRADGSHPLMLAIRKRRSVKFINLHIPLHDTQWDAENEKVVNHKTERRLNVYLGHIRMIVDEALLTMSVEDKNDVDKVRVVLMSLITGDEPKDTKVTFMRHFQAFSDRHEKKSTRGNYEHTIRRIRDFDKKADKLRFDDITPEWLERFDKFLEKTSPSANARSVKMRCIRAVINDAISHKLTNEYPFRWFRIKSQRTEHRALTVEQLRHLFTMPVEDWEQRWVDNFKLMFLLCGISPVDLAHLGRIKQGRISYRRSKTGEPVSIWVEPEAMELINKYKGKTHLLDILDRYGTHTNWLRRLNRTLKTIGGVRRVERRCKDGKQRLVSVHEKTWPELSAYWARHTWASIASSIGIPMDVIGRALGHSQRSVTDIYVAFDKSRIDDANRRVINWVLYGKK